MTHFENIVQTIEMVKAGQITAPAEFIEFGAPALTGLCNGCGSSQSKFDFVPDSIYGLKIKPACHIHDFQYYRGKTIEDKKEADRRFLNNMLRLIEADTNRLRKFIKPLMRRRALKYYEAVNRFGGTAFWSGK